MFKVPTTRQTLQPGLNLDNRQDFLTKPRTQIPQLNFDVKGEDKENHPFQSKGSSMKDGIRMEFRLYNSENEARMAAMQSSNGKTPIHHPPHKRGDRCHFHVSYHTLKTKQGPKNVHFMYGDQHWDLSPFQSESGSSF